MIFILTGARYILKLVDIKTWKPKNDYVNCITQKIEDEHGG
jgi:hypothetical protein